MAVIGKLTIDIGANIDSLKKGISQGVDAVKGAGSKFGAFGSKVLKGAMVTGAGLAAGGILSLGTAVASVGATSVDVASQIKQSQNDIIAELGATQEVAEGLGQVATKVFANNFADSIEDATGVVIEARRQLGALSDSELQDAAENALRLSDTFDVDYVESLNAANALMDEFGLTQGQAFNFLAKGFQKGLNNSDDFLDSIGEYSNLFADTGFDAAQMFSLMETGAASGVLGTDKIADAIKEMGIIMNESGDGAHDAFRILGMDFEAVSASVAAGDATWADYFPTIIEGLAGIEDPLIRSSAQVGLFGTMAEDLGTSFTTGLSTATTSLDDMAGAVDILDAKYNNFGAMFEGLKRQALVALAPIGEKLLELANRLMPYVEAIFNRVAAAIPPLIEAIMPAIDAAINWITETAIPALQRFGNWFMTVGMPAVVAFYQPIVAALIPGLKQLAQWAMQLAQLVLPILAKAWELITNNMHIVKPILIAIGVAIVALSSPVSLIVAAVVALATAWANNWGDIQGKTQAVIDWFNANIRPTLEAIFNWITQTALPAVQAAWSAVWEKVSAVFRAVWGIIQSYWAAVKAAFQGDWRAFGEHLRAAWDQNWELIKNILRSAATILVNLVMSAMRKIVEAVRNIDWMAVGQAILEGIGRGIMSGIGRIQDAARNAAKAALDAAKGFLGIRSPSALFEQEVGGNMVAGLVNSLRAGAAQVNAATQALVAPDLSGLGGATPAGAGAGAGTGGGTTIYIDQIIIQANDEESGRRAGAGLVDALRERGLQVEV